MNMSMNTVKFGFVLNMLKWRQLLHRHQDFLKDLLKVFVKFLKARCSSHSSSMYR